MKDHINATQVGAPDPTLKNSPVVEDTDYDYGAVGQTIQGAPHCHFNGASFNHGQHVCSGNELLKCDRGTWVRVGSCDPDNP